MTVDSLSLRVMDKRDALQQHVRDFSMVVAREQTARKKKLEAGSV